MKGSLSKWTPGMSVLLRGWWWDWHCLTSLSLAWTAGPRAPSASSVTTLSCVVTQGREGGHAERPAQAEEVGLEGLGEVQQDQVQGSAAGSR